MVKGAGSVQKQQQQQQQECQCFVAIWLQEVTVTYAAETVLIPYIPLNLWIQNLLID